MGKFGLPLVLVLLCACADPGARAAQHAVPPQGDAVGVLPVVAAPWLVVEASVNGSPARLVVDTGSAVSTLDPGFAARAGLRSASFVRSDDFEGQRAKRDVMVADRLDLGGMVFTEVGFVATAMSAVNARSCLPVDGTLGLNVLRHAAFEIDVQGETMVLAPSAEALPVRDGGETLRLDPDSDGARVSVSGGGAEHRAMVIDTSSSLGLVASPKLMKELPVPTTVPGRGALPQGLRTSSDEVSAVEFFAWPAVDVGGLDLAGVDAVGGLATTSMGLGVLSRYLVRFETGANTVRLWPGEEPPPRGLHDLGVRWSAASSIVTFMADGSPAQQAGIELGDRVMEIDGAPLAELEDQERCWLALQAPQSDALSVRLERGGKTFDVQLQARAILAPVP